LMAFQSVNSFSVLPSNKNRERITTTISSNGVLKDFNSATVF